MTIISNNYLFVINEYEWLLSVTEQNRNLMIVNHM